MPISKEKAARAAHAKDTINTIIPSILSSNVRAKNGVQGAQLLRGRTDLPKLTTSPHDSIKSPLKVSLIQSDTLTVAKSLRDLHLNRKIAILNMASPLQPGGGVLRGAKAQEESLSLRSTLYPSLKQQWYRHPDDGVIFTPDVLVFRSHDLRLLDHSDRFYVDVISCAAPRHPELSEEGDRTKYADPKDEELMSLKIKFIMRTAVKKGITHLVLGALGCGAYHNPIEQVAEMFRKCLLGRSENSGPEEEWAAAGVEEIVFAILDGSSGKKVWEAFAREFGNRQGVQIVVA